MDIYVYSDESGTFDKAHNTYFVFGGIILLGKDEREACARKYSHVEKVARTIECIPQAGEVKATTVSNKCKGKLYRSLNQYEKFGVIIYQPCVLDRIFHGKKDKQRYLDYAYKIAVKRKFQNLIASGTIDPSKVDHLHFYVDEHTTATNGCYELREGLEQEFKNGTYNWQYQKFYKPIFPKVQGVDLQFCNSSSVILVRAADIIANKIYHMSISGFAEAASTGCSCTINPDKLFVSQLP